MEEPRRKRHRPEGEGVQPPAPRASSNYREGSSSSSGSALPPPPAPPPLEPPPLEKTRFGPGNRNDRCNRRKKRKAVPKRRKEHPEMPQAADSRSSSSSSNESSTDTEMGLVDMRTIRCENSEAESRCRGGPVTLDLMEWDFDKADCRNKCRKLVENSKPLLLIGSPIGSASTGQPSTGRGDKEQARAVLHLAFICELYDIREHGGRYFLHTQIQIPQTDGNNLQWWIA